jgi:hypothetical protein
MIVLSVLDSIDCPQVILENDPWIPLKVSWDVPRVGQPLYLRVSGDEGGEVEVKVDPISGALLQVIVLDVPPGLEGFDLLPTGTRSEGQTPVLERSKWEWKVTPDYSEVKNSVARSVEKLRMARVVNVVTLSFSSQPAVKFIGCGSVRVGVAIDGELVSIVVLDG